MAEQVQLPEPIRKHLMALSQAQQVAVAQLPETAELRGAVRMAVLSIGLNPDDNHSVNWQTGVVTLAGANGPTPVKDEAAS